jgi:DNA-binding PadR family transcriptional regulator
MRKAQDGHGLRRPNDPPVLILTSLAGGPKHGHALAKDIEQFAGVALGPGALYGAITRLEERGLIEPLDIEERRRPYRITATGAAALAEAVSDMRRITEVGTSRLSLIGHDYLRRSSKGHNRGGRNLVSHRLAGPGLA